MAFDWTAVDGYKEDMSAEEKLALLDGYEPKAPEPAVDLKGYVKKSQFDSLASELATAKKQLKSRMTEEEAREADRAAHEEAIEAELKTLRREKTISSHKASFLAQGYDDALASEAATALADGDTDEVFSIMAKHKVNAEKALRQQILKDVPVPPPGDNVTDELKEKAEQEKLRKYFGLR